MTDPDYRAMCAELVDALENARRIIERADGTLHINTAEFALRRARALLAEPEAEGPTDEELGSVMFQAVWECMDKASDLTNDEIDLLKARAVLARWGRPTPQPVAVSERLPGPEDCNEQWRCWLGGRQMGSGTPTWLLGYPAWAERFPDVHRFWLPANALPLPAPEGGEVQP